MDALFTSGGVSADMVTGLEILILVVALAFVFGASRLIDTVRPLFANAVAGLLVLLAVQWLFVFEITITPIVLVIVALGGVPGAILIVLLSITGVAFV